MGELKPAVVLADGVEICGGQFWVWLDAGDRGQVWFFRPRGESWRFLPEFFLTHFEKVRRDHDNSNTTRRDGEAKLDLQVNNLFNILKVASPYTYDRATVTILTADSWWEFVTDEKDPRSAAANAVIFGLAGAWWAVVCYKAAGGGDGRRKGIDAHSGLGECEGEQVAAGVGKEGGWFGLRKVDPHHRTRGVQGAAVQRPVFGYGILGAGSQSFAVSAQPGTSGGGEIEGCALHSFEQRLVDGNMGGATVMMLSAASSTGVVVVVVVVWNA